MSDIVPTETFSTPDDDDVMQSDEVPLHAIPVTVDGLVRVDNVPCGLGALRSFPLLVGAEPLLILPRDYRRKQATLWQAYTGGAPGNALVAALVSPDFGACKNMDGALLYSFNQVERYIFGTYSEMWARGVEVQNSANRFTTIAPTTTNDVILSVAVENWSR